MIVKDSVDVITSSSNSLITHQLDKKTGHEKNKNTIKASLITPTSFVIPHNSVESWIVWRNVDGSIFGNLLGTSSIIDINVNFGQKQFHISFNSEIFFSPIVLVFY